MKHYRIRTVAGGGLSVFIGGSRILFEIQCPDTKEQAYYSFTSVDFGFGAGKGSAAGPSSWTDFFSNNSITDFHGYVTIVAASAAAVVGYGGSEINFISGPAAGLTIRGAGWLTGAGAGFTGSHGWMRLES